MEGGAHPTETTKANGRSNFNAEESLANGFDDDDEFDKLIGRIAAPPKNKNTKGITTSKLAHLPDGLSSK
jgi:hypothetical protein